jgi:hypothetical protein
MRWLPPLLAVAACFDPSFSDRTRCGPNLECPAPRSCVQGVCLLAAPAADAGPDASGDKVTVVITKASTMGRGTIQIPGGAPCGADCPSVERLFPRGGGEVLIEARAEPGSYFQGWTGDCTGAHRFCTLTLDAAHQATGRFAATTANLVFATSMPVSGDLDGIANADQLCNDLAAEAGMARAFRALMNDGQMSTHDRMAAGGPIPRGFIRLDGLPIADTLADLLFGHQIWYPIAYDENGKPVAGSFWTGSNAVGDPAVTRNCERWNATNGLGAAGYINGGPTLLRAEERACSIHLPLVCIMTALVTTLPPPQTEAGKVIFVTAAPFEGDEVLANGPEACRAAKTGARVIVAGTAALDATTLYVRADGLPVGTGAEIAAGKLRTGVWLHADRSLSPAVEVWTGSTVHGQFDVQDACHNWLDNTSTATVGAPAADETWWHLRTRDCFTRLPIYCAVE